MPPRRNIVYLSVLASCSQENNALCWWKQSIAEKSENRSHVDVRKVRFWKRWRQQHQPAQSNCGFACAMNAPRLHLSWLLIRLWLLWSIISYLIMCLQINIALFYYYTLTVNSLYSSVILRSSSTSSLFDTWILVFVIFHHFGVFPHFNFSIAQCSLS